MTVRYRSKLRHKDLEPNSKVGLFSGVDPNQYEQNAQAAQAAFLQQQAQQQQQQQQQQPQTGSQMNVPLPQSHKVEFNVSFSTLKACKGDCTYQKRLNFARFFKIQGDWYTP